MKQPSKQKLNVVTKRLAKRYPCRHLIVLARPDAKFADIINIVQHVSQLDAMNQMIPYLPCLKHMESLPTDLSTMNTKFSELEMYTNHITSLSLKMITAYYTSKGQYFPTSWKKLEGDLILIEAQVQHQGKMIQELCSKAGLLVS